MAKTLHIYLHEPMRTRAEAGEINLFNKMAQALAGWTLRFHEDTKAERQAAPDRGYGLFHMQEPPVPTILCLRRAYHYPFWRIEKTNERWNFDVARAGFDAAQVPPGRAAAFFSRRLAALYAGSDFHHIAADLFWFFQRKSVKAGSAKAVERIHARFAAHGFPLF